MQYAIEQGPTEATIIRNCIRDGRPLPKAIADAPELSPGLRFYYVAFDELASCRYHDLGRIPWTAVQHYRETNALDDEQGEMLIDVVRMVDAWFLEYLDAKSKKPKGRGRTKGKR